MRTDFMILILAGYLLGSIPFGLIIAKAHGKDLRSIGSGNIGATNLSRALGKKWGYFCFCLDTLKGLCPIVIAAKRGKLIDHHLGDFQLRTPRAKVFADYVLQGFDIIILVLLHRASPVH